MTNELTADGLRELVARQEPGNHIEERGAALVQMGKLLKDNVPQIIALMEREAQMREALLDAQEKLHWREEALRHATGRFLNINICLSSGGTKREAIAIADTGEDACKMALAREELPVQIVRGPFITCTDCTSGWCEVGRKCARAALQPEPKEPPA